MSNHVEPGVSRRNVATLVLGAVGLGLAASTQGCLAQVEEQSGGLAENSDPLAVELDTYAALRNLSWTGTGPYHACTVRGRASVADGGQGVFIWDPNFQPGNAYDDDGTYLKPNHYGPSTAGRWRRVYSGPVNVLWFGADPTGTNDSLLAFRRAATSAGPGGTVFVPRGRYAIPPDSTFLWWARRWVGESLHPFPEQGTVIRPLGSGTVLANTGNSATIFENIWFDGLGQVDLCVRMLGAHNSTLRNVVVSNANQIGLSVESTANLLAEGVTALKCATGMRFSGCSASTVVSPFATLCSGPGIEVTGAAASSPATVYAGSITITGAAVDACGTDGSSPLVLVRGLEGGTIALDYLHVLASQAPVALVVTEGTHNVSFRGGYFEHATSAVLAHIDDASMCSFEQLAGSGTSSTNRIVVDAQTSSENRFVGCHRASDTNQDPTTIEFVDGATTWLAQSSEGRLQASTPPPAGFGTWRIGHIVDNGAPAVGSPMGWVFTSSGWVAQPNL